MNFTQLRFDFMDESELVPVPSNDNPPVNVTPSDDEQGESAVLLIFPAPEKAPSS